MTSDGPSCGDIHSPKTAPTLLLAEYFSEKAQEDSDSNAGEKKEETVNYKAKALIATIMVALVFTLAHAQGTSNEPTSDHFRFQMITATVDGMPDKNGHASEERTVFLLELDTGRVWKFGPTVLAYRKDGSVAGPALPAYFESLNVDGLRGWNGKQAVQDWLQQQKGDK